MTNSKFYSIIIMLAALIVLTSCSEWLTVKPENDLIKEEFWKRKSDVENVLAASYSALRECALECFIWGELRADNVKFTNTTEADYAKIAKTDISISNPKIVWARYYNAINLANTLMFFAPDVLALDKTYTEKMNNGITAEALFIRSLCYFYMVRIWKDVPLVLNATVSDTMELSLPKNTEAEIIAQIKGDLIRAKDLAYTDEFASNPVYYKGRANKYSITALLSDVCLWAQQYDDCIKYCDELINLGKFGLEPGNSWFNLYYPGNSMRESLFEIQYNDVYEQQENPIYYNILPIGGAKISLPITFLGKFLKEDIRSFSQLKSVANRFPTWKYYGKDNSSLKRTMSERDANFIFYRYADILLNKAEALIEIDRVAEANQLIREISERSNIPFLDIISKKELKSYLLDERCREFSLEGKRWFDILRFAKRNNFENKSIIMDLVLSEADAKTRPILASRVTDTMSYYLPIPYTELQNNPNLEQNSYYLR